MKEKRGQSAKASRYLAIHLRFEIDMVAHSLCEFGGGEEERQELEKYREIHFPALAHLKKTTKYAYSYFYCVAILVFIKVHLKTYCFLPCVFGMSDYCDLLCKEIIQPVAGYLLLLRSGLRASVH